MNKHLKIFVSVLFIVIILLAIGITRFHFAVSKDTENSMDKPLIYAKHETDKNGLTIFESSNKLLGVIDANEKVIIDPEWLSIDFAGENCFIVSEKFNGKVLFGCIDIEENVIVPFIYSRIERFGTEEKNFYSAKIAENNSCIIYDDTFTPCFDRIWDKYEAEMNRLNLYWGDNSYSYFAEDEGFEMKSAVIKSSIDDIDYSISFYSRILLSKLDYQKLEKIAESVSSYLAYSSSGDYALIHKYIEAGQENNFKTFFWQYPNVFSKKFKSVTDVSVYPSKGDDGTQYITASVTLNAEVGYMEGEEGMSVSDKYHAVIRFEDEEFGIKMISASFTDDLIPQKTHENLPEDSE